MEFHQKLQELRKGKGLTQEELAQALFVSRTAVSKWESGRGYPNIDSLKALAKYFSVTVDEILSGEEVLTIAEDDSKQKKKAVHALIFGLLDCSIAVLFFLPLFGNRAEGVVQAVSLLSLTGIASYLKVVYFIVVIAIILCGIMTFALQNWHNAGWEYCRGRTSFVLSAMGLLLFIVSLQPYAAALLFVFLMIKVLLVVKWK